MAKDYIPRANGKFDLFQSNLVKMVVDNAATWNIPIAEVNILQANSIKYGKLYKAIFNKGNRTQMQVMKHDQFREKTFEPDIRVFVNSFLRVNKSIDAAALSAMGIPERKKRRRHRTKIETAPNVFIENIATIWLRFVCRIESHYGKGSIHPESDGIEFRYSIGTKPDNPKKATYSRISKKAHFILKFEEEHRGKTVYIYARWINLVNDDLSGPWCNVLEANL